MNTSPARAAGTKETFMRRRSATRSSPFIACSAMLIA
jgi:hypothetical protein